MMSNNDAVVVPFASSWSPSHSLATAEYSKGSASAPMGCAGAEMPTSQVELSVACRNLINRDVFSKSDPMVILYQCNDWQDKYYEIGRTEMISDNLNPDFVKRFQLSYNFECIQKLKFEVWDVDPVVKLGDVKIYDGGNDFLGKFETTLADIVAYQGRQMKGQLSGVSGRKDCGTIILVVEELAHCKQIVSLQMCANQLSKTRFWGRCDPFLVISRANEDGTFSVVHKTEFCKSTQNPTWKTITLKVSTLCNADKERAIRFECYDDRFDGQHKRVGQCFSSLSQLLKGPGHDNNYELLNPKKARRSKKYRNSGKLELISIIIREEITFLDYIRNGTQLHFAVAIDFTASNGDPRDPCSLHYIDFNGRPNCYEIALKSVGEIISHYNSLGMYPAYGFGAKLPPSMLVSHQFPLNGNTGHPYCRDINEILIHYRNTVSSVILYGPTNFAPVINNTACIARQHQNGQHYFILLIITDGVISDLHATKSAIVSAASLPMSIIIVGVGNANFDAMNELDGDEVRINVDGRRAERDIVQFVALNRFISKDGPWIKSQADLAREVLYEIPNQLCQYMKSKVFVPTL